MLLWIRPSPLAAMLSMSTQNGNGIEVGGIRRIDKFTLTAALHGFTTSHMSMFHIRINVSLNKGGM